ncbi:MAG TPA: hypothetical protein VFM93_01990 [Candidatus Limnocylindria bacterium]|nr:hypothetical protein [Candidatus Limnocylindria bacterium]
MRALLALTGATLLAVLLAAPAAAGGWAVTTLDSLPDRFEAGTAYDIGFTIRQHGVTPVDLADVALVISKPDGKRLSSPARKDGATGHYTARVVFPSDGAWTWAVKQDWFGMFELGTVKVVMPGTADAPAQGPLAAAAPVTLPAAPAAPARQDPLVLAGLLVAVAGAAVLLGDRLGRALTPARA